MVIGLRRAQCAHDAQRQCCEQATHLTAQYSTAGVLHKILYTMKKNDTIQEAMLIASGIAEQ